jgi:sugar phosphate isomerase/epimerase
MLAHLGHVCRVGGGLGATRLVFGSPRNRDRSGLSDEAALAAAAKFFHALGEVAAGHGVIVCLEPNPPAYNSNFMRTADETAQVVRATAHPAIRMQFDTGALTLNGEDARAVLAAHGDIIGHIHASEPNLVALGTGGTDHVAMAAALRAALPGHVVCVEMVAAGDGANLRRVDEALALAVACYGG